MEKTPLEQARDAAFASTSDDHDLILHIGYFFAWYNQVEFRLTLLMAIVMNERDFPAFHELVRGMDGKTKVRRFKAICRTKKWSLDEVFEKQLNYYSKTISDLRDRLAHRALVNDETLKDRFHYATLDKMPWAQLGVPNSTKGVPVDHIRKIEFFGCGYWLNQFADDMNEILDLAIAREVLGAKTPRAKLPSGRAAEAER